MIRSLGRLAVGLATVLVMVCALVVENTSGTHASKATMPSPSSLPIIPSTGTSSIPAPARLGKIVFASARDGDFEIFVMRADGSRLRQITHNELDDTWPSWSPDGRKIAFVRSHKGYRGLDVTELWKARADGTWEKELDQARWPDVLSYPEWSPDGRWIAYSVNWDGASVLAVRTDGGRFRGRTRSIVGSDTSSVNEDPSWSADGERILFISEGHGLDSAASRCNLEGGCDVQAIGLHLGNMTNPRWSPDGSQILVSGDSPDDDPDDYRVDRDVWIVDADGNATPFADGGSDSSAGGWSPDGEMIVFYSKRGRSYDIYVMDADGSNLRRLTDHPRADIHPDWI